MDVEIPRVDVSRHQRLMVLQPHASQEYVHGFPHLLIVGHLVFLPGHGPMRDRHPASCGFLGQRNHFPLPRFRGPGQEIHAEAVKPFPVSFLVLVANT